MTTPNLVRFQEKLAADPALQEQVKSLFAASPEDWSAAVAQLATAHGLPLTAEEVLQASQSPAPLSDADLETISGGWYGGADSFSRGLEKYYDDYVRMHGKPPPQ